MGLNNENMSLRNELRVAKAQLERLSAELRRGRSTPSSAATSSGPSPNDRVIQRLWDDASQRYSRLIAPFVHKPSFGFAACPDIDPTSPRRFESLQTREAAQAAELYAVVPEELHSLLASRDSSVSEMVSPLACSYRRRELILVTVQQKGLPRAIFHAAQPCQDCKSNL